eukprot:scaffold685_cov191-Alexandrium_tamarense.AAC.8
MTARQLMMVGCVALISTGSIRAGQRGVLTRFTSVMVHVHLCSSCGVRRGMIRMQELCGMSLDEPMQCRQCVGGWRLPISADVILSMNVIEIESSACADVSRERIACVAADMLLLSLNQPGVGVASSRRRFSLSLALPALLTTHLRFPLASQQFH